MNATHAPLRFVIVPKVAHPWFEEVRRGAVRQAAALEEAIGRPVVVEYVPPATADAAEQDAVLAAVVASRPAGIAVDPVDEIDRLPGLAAARAQGVPFVVFDSPSSDPTVCSIGNDFAAQGAIAARRLVDLIGGTGTVAVMQGVPRAPNHHERYEAQCAVLAEHPGIVVVDGGIDDDDIETACTQAAAVLAEHPDLAGYLCCDASGPIGIARAVREADRVGRVRIVGMDAIEPILREVEAGVIDSSAATIPDLQGALAVLVLWQASLGLRLPRRVDTGIDVVTQDNVGDFLAAAAGPDPEPI